jgi:hypothetical protein
MMDIHMVEGMSMLECLLKEWPEVKVIDMEEERLSKERSEVEDMNMTTDVFERYHDDMVLMRHMIGDGAACHVIGPRCSLSRARRWQACL